MVTGLFNDRDSAESAYNAVASRGYGKDDVNLVMSDEMRKTHFGERGNTRTELGTKAAEGAGVGGAIGGTIGAVAAAVAAVGTSIAIPGLGPGHRPADRRAGRDQLVPLPERHDRHRPQ